MSSFIDRLNYVVATFGLTSFIYHVAGTLFGATPGEGFNSGGEPYAYADFASIFSSWSLVGVVFIQICIGIYVLYGEPAGGAAKLIITKLSRKSGREAVK